jgi:hypothetical protein
MGLETSLDQRWLSGNLLQWVAQDHLFLWGNSEPYCLALQHSCVGARHCLDDFALISRLSPLTRIAEDLNRSIAIAGGLPLHLLGEIVSRFAPDSVLSEDLRNLATLGKIPVGFGVLERELERVADALPKLGSSPNSFYLYHSALPHFPYLLDRDLNQSRDIRNASFELATSPEHMAHVMQSYLRQIEATDKVLGKLLDAIKQRDPTAIVIITSDHGVDGEWSKNRKGRTEGGTSPSVIEVPLYILLPPNFEPPPTPLRNYQHLDFVPTLLDLLNQPAPSGLQGVSSFRGSSDFYFRSGPVELHKYP